MAAVAPPRGRPFAKGGPGGPGRPRTVDTVRQQLVAQLGRLGTLPHEIEALAATAGQPIAAAAAIALVVARLQAATPNNSAGS